MINALFSQLKHVCVHIQGVIPVRYDHNITATLKQYTDSIEVPGATAQGVTDIRVRISASTRCVVLHAGDNLNISSVSAVLDAGAVLGEEGGLHDLGMQMLHHAQAKLV